MLDSSTLAARIASRYRSAEKVKAVAMAGSRGSGVFDPASDLDLYVYVLNPLTMAERKDASAGAVCSEIGNCFWEPGDEWIEPEGIAVDVMFRDTGWIEQEVERVMARHEASVGYSTCFVYNVRNSSVLFDTDCWFAELQARIDHYPAELKQNILAKNYPILRNNISSYVHQIEKAIQRGDAVSVNHRTSALLASYFDILFAVNEQFHPGEKRLISMALKLCSRLPDNFATDLEELLSCAPNAPAITRIHVLLDSLDRLLRREQLIP